ncbi:type I methionyl aminopeptidase [Candidatus Poribacteria bacterium]
MIPLRSKAEIERLRFSGKMVFEVLQVLGSAVKPGIATEELNRLAGQLIRERGGRPAPPQVGFPGDICVSVNSEVVHGVPGKRSLYPGDIASIDVMAAFDGYYGDVAATFPVGEISEEAKRLLEVTKGALDAGISKAVAGNRLGDISSTVQDYVESRGCSVVRDFVGHGIGANMWEKPQVPNFGSMNRGPRLKTGMVLAIEPMVNSGRYAVDILDDEWTAVARDGSLSAHFEHTIVILDDGPEILTRS